jgi:hypothetical protein
MQQSDFIERLEQYQRDQAERRRQSDERWQRLLAAVAEAGDRYRAWGREHGSYGFRPIEPRPYLRPRGTKV